MGNFNNILKVLYQNKNGCMKVIRKDGSIWMTAQEKNSRFKVWKQLKKVRRTKNA